MIIIKKRKRNKRTKNANHYLESRYKRMVMTNNSEKKILRSYTLTEFDLVTMLDQLTARYTD